MKKLNYLSFICLFLIISMDASAQTYSGGSGTESDPYLISSNSDLELLSSAISRDGNYSSGKFFLLTQDITTPVTGIIGINANYPFRGTFNGGGFTINANINATDMYAGVFGYTVGALIKNLGITGNITNISVGNTYVGGICGYGSSTTITNCYNTASITSSSSDYNSYSGGICGYTLNTAIRNCYNLNNVSSSSSSSSYSSYSYSGGISGYAKDNATISNCYNTGSIYSFTSYSYFSHSGGICGANNSRIENCFTANENITAKYGEYNSPNIGRIATNLSNGSIVNSYALSTTMVNDATINSQNANSNHGRDMADVASFQSQTWLENYLEWDFTDDWYFPNSSGSFPLLKKESIINFVLPTENTIYGEIKQMTLAATSNNNLTPIIFTSSDNDIAEVIGAILYIKKAGTVTITASQIAVNNLSSGATHKRLTIAKKPLTIRANNASITFGDNPPQFTCTYEGFVSGETENNLIKLPTINSNATITSNVGDYIISPVGAESDNYEFNYETGTLTIQKRSLIATPDSISRFYGDNNPTLSLQYEGFVNGNTKSNLSTQPTVHTLATKTSPIGNYEITCSGGNATNYTFIYEKGNLEVCKAPLTITAHNKNRSWGVENPDFTFSYSGFKNNESESVLTAKPQISCYAERLSPSGKYPIEISGAEAANYDINHVNGLLTITKSAQGATTMLNFTNPNLVSGMNNRLLLSTEQEDLLLSYQLDITFPSFVSVDLDNIALSNRCNNAHTLDAVKVSSYPNKYRFLIYSPSNTPIAGYSGELILIPLIVDWNAAPTNYADYSVSTSAGTTVLYISETDKPEKPISNTSAIFSIHKMGDVNIDGTVTISDIVAEVDYILDKNPQPFFFEAGDIDRNGSITIMDLAQLVNLILTQNSSSVPQQRVYNLIENNDYELSLSNLELDYENGITSGNLILSMKNANPVIALNWDLTLPENVIIDEDNLAFTSDRTNRNKHTIAVNRLSRANTWRFVIYSSKNREISGDSGELITIPIIIDEQTAIGELPAELSATNLIYSENDMFNEVTPAHRNGILANGVSISSIAEIENSSFLQMYPNPAKDYLFIQSNYPVEKIEIYNQSGSIVLKNDVVSEKVNISNLNSGFYLVRIYVNDVAMIRKILINNP